MCPDSWNSSSEAMNDTPNSLHVKSLIKSHPLIQYIPSQNLTRYGTTNLETTFELSRAIPTQSTLWPSLRLDRIWRRHHPICPSNFGTLPRTRASVPSEGTIIPYPACDSFPCRHRPFRRHRPEEETAEVRRPQNRLPPQLASALPRQVPRS